MLKLKASFCRISGQPLVEHQPVMAQPFFLRMRPLLEQMQPEPLGEDEEKRGAPVFTHGTIFEPNLLFQLRGIAFLIASCLGTSDGFLFLMPYEIYEAFSASLPFNYWWTH